LIWNWRKVDNQGNSKRNSQGTQLWCPMKAFHSFSL
jgi:hypothetical protein